MGLTVHYSLRCTTRSPTKVRELIGKLRSRALDLPFERVDEIIELKGNECDFQQHGDESPHRWLLIQARQLVPDPRDQDCRYAVNPRHVIAFSTWPGHGCEEANFGLCRYPATLQVGRWVQRTIRTHLGPWCWGSFCKTEYASNRACGGMPNFIRCHLAVIAMLDQARALGIVDEVSDEGDYWEERDVPALARTVGQWNASIAHQVAALRSVFGNTVDSPVTNFPDFRAGEHLAWRCPSTTRKRQKWRAWRQQTHGGFPSVSFSSLHAGTGSPRITCRRCFVSWRAP